jgi:hypothetical protein
VITAIETISVFCSCLWFHFRRDYVVVQRRKYWLVMAQCFGLVGYSIVANAFFIFPETTPCFALIIFQPILIHFSATVFLLRLTSICVTFKIEQMMEGHVRQSRIVESSWWIRNKNLFRDANYAKVLGISAIVDFIPHLIIAIHFLDIMMLPKTEADCRMVTFTNADVILGIIGVKVFIGTFVIIYFSSRVKESLGLKREYAVCAGAALMAFALNIPLLTGTSAQKSILIGFCETFGINAYPMLFETFPEMMAALTTTLLPVILTYQRETESSVVSNEELLSSQEIHQKRKPADNHRELAALLLSEEGFQMFKERMQEEFSVENILFWQDVNRYRNGDVSGQFVFENYILESSALCVPISAKVRKALEAKFSVNQSMEILQVSGSNSEILLSTVSTDAFDAAQTEIFNLMVKDTFLRFHHTPKYQQFLAKNPMTTSETSKWAPIDEGKEV